MVLKYFIATHGWKVILFLKKIHATKLILWLVSLPSCNVNCFSGDHHYITLLLTTKYLILRSWSSLRLWSICDINSWGFENCLQFRRWMDRLSCSELSLSMLHYDVLIEPECYWHQFQFSGNPRYFSKLLSLYCHICWIADVCNYIFSGLDLHLHCFWALKIHSWKIYFI